MHLHREPHLAFHVHADFKEAALIDGFSIDLQYFQPGSNPLIGAWLNYPELTHLPLVEDETSASASLATSRMRSYGTRWRWRAAGKNQNHIWAFSEWCYFNLNDPLNTLDLQPFGNLPSDRTSSRHLLSR
jgi:hypothetical protein